jgi:hypothetical protein
MRKAICFAMLFFFLCCVLASPGGEFWEKKEYKQWSDKESAKLLLDSPWAKELALASVGVMNVSKESTDAQQPFVKYQVQFRSAKPIRQAIVRQALIAQKYDSLPPENKQELDKRAESIISADVSDTVIVYVTYVTNNTDYDRQLARHWQSQTMDLIKNSVYLIPQKGDKVSILKYAAEQGAQRGFQFIFPREVNGKPIVDPVKDKTLKLEFAYPVIGGMGDGRAFLEFRLDKMVFEGNVAY